MANIDCFLFSCAPQIQKTVCGTALRFPRNRAHMDVWDFGLPQTKEELHTSEYLRVLLGGNGLQKQSRCTAEFLWLFTFQQGAPNPNRG